MARLVEEVLQTWRLGERVLRDLPPVDPDHETVRMHVAELRALYHELTDRRTSTRRRLDNSATALGRARASIERAHARLRAAGADPP